MKLVICSVFDTALNAFGRPIFVHTTNQAVRSFSDEVNQSDSPMNAHPEDYDLYHIGNFHDDTGEMESIIPSTLLVRASDVIKE